MPLESLPEIPILPSCEENTTYRTASGKVLTNAGMQEIRGCTSNGVRIGSKWQVMPGIQQPLMSIGKMAEAGHRVIFDSELPGGGTIVHKASGKQIPLVKVGNTYEIDLYVDTPPFPRPVV